MCDDDSQTGNHSEPLTHRRDSGSLCITAAYIGVVVLVGFFVEVAADLHWQPVPMLHSDRGFWMPLVGVIGIAAILFRRGFPKHLAQVVGHVALLVVLIIATWWSVEFELVRTVAVTTAVIMQLMTAACWVFAVAGLAAVPVWLHRRSSSAPLWVKAWFAATLFVGFSEAGVRFIEHPSHTPVRLPDHWPAFDESEQEFRIAAIGGSTMLGFPYEPKIDIPQICKAHLELQFPDYTFTVENVARGGINFQTAIEQLQSLDTRPDLILLYTGHNEAFFDVDNDVIRPESALPILDNWFQWSAAYCAVVSIGRRLYFAKRDHEQFGRKLFDSPQYSEHVSQERLVRFRQTLIDFARACHQKGIALIWFVPAAGEGTFEPNRSCAWQTISTDEQRRIRELLADARQLEQTGRWNQAEAIYRRLAEAYPDFAEFHFRLGEVLVEQGSIVEAKRHFRSAVDLDGHPCRAQSSYCECIIEVARQEGIPIIDSKAELSQMTDDGLLDRAVFHDNVHMTMAGYWALGRAAAESVSAQEFLGGRGSDDSVEIDFPTYLRDVKFDTDDLATAYDRTAFALEHLSQQRFDGTRRLTEAEQYRRWAADLRAGVIQPGQAGTESLQRLFPAGVQFP